MEPVSLGPDSEGLFSGFRCATFRQRWTRDIEDTIRNTLAGALEADPSMRALGYVDAGALVSLIVWCQVASKSGRRLTWADLTEG